MEIIKVELIIAEITMTANRLCKYFQVNIIMVEVIKVEITTVKISIVEFITVEITTMTIIMLSISKCGYHDEDILV